MTAPERTFVTWPNKNSAGLAFNKSASNRTEYVRADLAAVPAQVCPECSNTGLRDTGGVCPWGEGIFVACDHNEPQPDPRDEVIARLVDALGFYADMTAWTQPPVKTREGLLTLEYENQASKMQKDRGAKARAAIAAAKAVLK